MSECDPGDGTAASLVPTEPQAENRNINRIPVRLAVSHKGRSAPLGRTRDLSLQGIFIETNEPFDVGSIVPLVIDLDPKEQLVVRAEVVRKTADGMGLRFRDLENDASRKLRRWAVDHTSIEGSRRQIDQLIEASARIEPIRGRERIQQLLEDIRGSGASITLIPTERIARHQARLVTIDRDQIVFAADAGHSLVAGEEVYALLTLAFVSYSFGFTVKSATRSSLNCGFPETVVFSERRIKDRRPAPPGSSIRWPSPWQAGVNIELPLLDTSSDGLAFRAPESSMLTPGTRLDDACIVTGGRTESLRSAEVRSVRLVEDDSGRWLRIGVSLGVSRLGRARKIGERVARKTPLQRLFDTVKAAFSVMVHRGKARIGSEQTVHRVTVRSEGLRIVGILDRTTPTEEPLSAPLVIVVPGFAGRKEQFAFLAGTLIEGFRRQNADIAVLRCDGTNNLGESGKDPGCEGSAMHALHYTVGGLERDITAMLDWAKNNPYIAPTHIVIVSASMASVGVRRILATKTSSDISMWFAYMGGADAIDIIRNVSGYIDLYATYRRGQRVGIASLNGVLCDADHFWADISANGTGDLDESREEMAKIRADVVWLRGRYDTFMDPRRIDAIMSVPAQAERTVIDVDCGHIPRTGQEAIAQFVLVTERIWTHIHKSQMLAFKPSLGKLAVKAESEWAQVRRANIGDRALWWRTYMEDYDVFEYVPEYTDFIEYQADLVMQASPARPAVLELGAGTGNLTRRLVDRGALVATTDIVSEVLNRLPTKLGASRMEHVKTLVLDADGTPMLAMARFVRGDLRRPQALSERLPGAQASMVAELVVHDGDDLTAALVGSEVDIARLATGWGLSPGAHALLADLNLLARVVLGRTSAAAAATKLQVLPPSILETKSAFPFEDQSFDAVASSLVLSYLTHPDDLLAEAFRVLKPGGVLIASSLVPDAEMSRYYLPLLTRISSLEASAFGTDKPLEAARAELDLAARRFSNQAAELVRLEEEGLFRFFTGADLAAMAARRGFVNIRVEGSFGVPSQAAVLLCTRP